MQTNNNWMLGHISPAGHSLDTPALSVSTISIEMEGILGAFESSKISPAP